MTKSCRVNPGGASATGGAVEPGELPPELVDPDGHLADQLPPASAVTAVVSTGSALQTQFLPAAFAA